MGLQLLFFSEKLYKINSSSYDNENHSYIFSNIDEYDDDEEEYDDYEDEDEDEYEDEDEDDDSYEDEYEDEEDNDDVEYDYEIEE